MKKNKKENNQVNTEKKYDYSFDYNSQNTTNSMNYNNPLSKYYNLKGINQDTSNHEIEENKEFVSGVDELKNVDEKKQIPVIKIVIIIVVAIILIVLGLMLLNMGLKPQQNNQEVVFELSLDEIVANMKKELSDRVIKEMQDGNRDKKINVSGTEIKQYMPSITDELIDKVKIEDDKLVYKLSISKEDSEKFEKLDIKREAVELSGELFTFDVETGTIHGFSKELIEKINLDGIIRNVEYSNEELEKNLKNAIENNNIGNEIKFREQKDKLIDEEMEKKIKEIEKEEKYKGIRKLIIPDKIENVEVKAIKENAFENYRFIQKVKLPNGVLKIGENAFKNNKIHTLDMENKLVLIEKSAFQNNNIDFLQFPISIIKIGDYAFENNQLQLIKFNDKIKKIGVQAFARNRLEKIDIPKSVTEILGGAFNNNRVENKKEGFIYSRKKDGTENKRTLVSYAGKEKTNIIIPLGVQEILDYGLANADLISIMIPKTITLIGENTFYKNKIEKLSVPKEYLKFYQTLNYINWNIEGTTEIIGEPIPEVILEGEDDDNEPRTIQLQNEPDEEEIIVNIPKNEKVNTNENINNQEEQNNEQDLNNTIVETE